MKKLSSQATKKLQGVVWLLLFIFLTGNSCATKKERSRHDESKTPNTEPKAVSSPMQSSPLFAPNNEKDTIAKKDEKKETPKAIIHHSENQNQLDSLKKVKDKEKGIRK
jgi:hypothetical protein